MDEDLVKLQAEELFESVRRNDLLDVECLICENRKLLDHIYPDYNLPIFLIACSLDGVQANTIQALLDLGANCNDNRSDNNWQAIHFAAQNNNFEILKVLLERNSGCVNAMDKYGKV